jgi:hypothetical protein
MLGQQHILRTPFAAKIINSRFFSLEFFSYIYNMKNLINRDLEKLDHSVTRKKEDPYERGHHSPYHDTDGVSPFQRIERICEAFIGKQYSKAFSKYCSEVPIYQQHFFAKEFENNWRNKNWPYYYVDKQGNIQKHKGTKQPQKVYYYSDDYRTELRHKDTGAPKPGFAWMYKNKYKEEDYISYVVEGYYIEFKSKKDPEYIRLTRDQAKRKAKAAREAEKEKAEKAYSFISKSEKEIEEEKAKNKITIERKGFDYAKSFRKDWQINPDSIKEKQGFKK